MRVAEPAEGYLVRLDEVTERLERLAPAAPPAGLTEPDQPSGEQWEWGQVWAHLGEFVPYWVDQMKMIIDAGSEEPVPFGRVKTDQGRNAAIEAGRQSPPQGLMERLASQLRDVRVLLTDLTSDDWRKRGVHETLGVMDIEAIVDMFLVKHLEDHADQLDYLVREATAS